MLINQGKHQVVFLDIKLTCNYSSSHRIKKSNKDYEKREEYATGMLP